MTLEKDLWKKKACEVGYVLVTLVTSKLHQPPGDADDVLEHRLREVFQHHLLLHLQLFVHADGVQDEDGGNGFTVARQEAAELRLQQLFALFKARFLQSINVLESYLNLTQSQKCNLSSFILLFLESYMYRQRLILYHCVKFRAVGVVVLKVLHCFLNLCDTGEVLVQSACRSATEHARFHSRLISLTLLQEGVLLTPHG